MAYYRRRRQVTEKQAIVNVDIDTLLSSLHSAPSPRARTASPINKTVLDKWQSRWARKNIITLYDGRRKVDTLPADRVVIIQYEKWGWRITTSQTAEATPLLIKSGTAPAGSDKIAESAGMCIYQTPQSLAGAATWQAERGRRDISLAMFDEAIALLLKQFPKEVRAQAKKNYKVFANCSALALSPGTAGEGDAAMLGAVKIARRILTATYN